MRQVQQQKMFLFFCLVSGVICQSLAPPTEAAEVCVFTEILREHDITVVNTFLSLLVCRFVCFLQARKLLKTTRNRGSRNDSFKILAEFLCGASNIRLGNMLSKCFLTTKKPAQLSCLLCKAHKLALLHHVLFLIWRRKHPRQIHYSVQAKGETVELILN